MPEEQAIIAFLAKQPTPEQVLAIRPSPEVQARAPSSRNAASRAS